MVINGPRTTETPSTCGRSRRSRHIPRAHPRVTSCCRHLRRATRAWWEPLRTTTERDLEGVPGRRVVAFGRRLIPEIERGIGFELVAVADPDDWRHVELRHSSC